MRPLRLVLGLSILAVVLVVAASLRGGDGDGAGPLAGPPNAIARAAERTQQEPGGHIAIHIVVSAGSKSFTMTGQGVYDSEGNRNRATMTFANPDSGAAEEMEVVGDGTVVYMRSSLFGSLPDGADWMSLDYSLGDDLESPVPTEGDAAGELELLEHATGGVEKLGKETVRGVPTTRYRGSISSSESAERLREAGGENLASVAEEKGGSSQVEVWVDADERVRRMRVISTQQPEKGDGPSSVDMRLDFVDFGTVPEISVPDSSEVFDMTSLAESELGISGDE